ncbi:MAG: hypothetical protein KAH01_05290 [Caldisericia bacterium]|nr:hypothetical protein [Caldisericia bacterium]
MKKAFILPTTFLMITLCLIYAFFSMNQMQLESITAMSIVEQSMLIDGANIGKEMLLDLHTEYSYDELKILFQQNSKYYIRSNSLRDYDSIIVFSTVNKRTKSEEYIVSVFLLKRNQIGHTDHPVIRVRIYAHSYYKCNMISHQFVKQAKITTQYKISTEESNFGEIISKELQNVPYYD